MTEPYLIYQHNESSEDTIGKFFFKNLSLTEGFKLIDFLRYDGIGVTNMDLIFQMYDSSQKPKYEDLKEHVARGDVNTINQGEVIEMPLNIGTSLTFKKDEIKIEMFSVLGKNSYLAQTSFEYFYPEKLKILMNDPSYIRSENLAKLRGNRVDIEVMMENCQVWVWSRALNSIVDVSPFVVNLNIDKSDVGSFSFSLNPVKNIDELISRQYDNVINYLFLNEKGEHQFDFFYKNFQYNDLAFIRFEKLKIEENLHSNDYNFSVDKVKLPGQVWDMIGLVDTCSMNQTFGNSNLETTVSGRDMMKLLVEDGSYFMDVALLQTEGKQQLVYGWQPDSKWFKRQFASGKFGGAYSPYNFPNKARGVKETMGFIVNQLSNLGVIENEDLFSAYGDRRSEQYTVEENREIPEVGKMDVLDVKFAQGVWQIIKMMVDDSLKDRRVVDNSISYVDGTILEQFNKICQMPFVEFFGDTYGDEFNIVARQPPFNREMVISFLRGVDNSERSSSLDGQNYQMIDIEEKDLQGYNSLQFDNTFYSWYQLTPNDTMIGAGATLLAGGLIPIIAFSRIAECFGNKRLVVPDNYLAANVVEGSEAYQDSNAYRRALLNDLKYVIDTNIYLPFTRTGTLLLTRGDRRIKKGMFIRVKPTNEIFYVDSVSNSVSFSADKVERSTTIRVSRGMIEEYIYGGNGYESDGQIIKKIDQPVKFSYFDIAKTVIDNVSHHEEVIEVDDPYFREPETQKSGFIEISKLTESYRSKVSKLWPPDQVDNALRIIQAESHGDPFENTGRLGKYFAGIPVTKGYEGSTSWGLFQINDKAHPEFDVSRYMIEDYNIEWGFKVYKEAGNSWQPWSTSRLPGVIAYGETQTEQVKMYNIQLGPRIDEAKNKSNPGALKDPIKKILYSYPTKDKGFEAVLNKVVESQVAGETIAQFLISLEPGLVDWKKTFYVFRQRITIGGSTCGSDGSEKMSDYTSDELAIAYVWARTHTKVTVGTKSVVVQGSKPLNKVKKTVTIFDDSFEFKLDDDQFDFFLKRKHFNIYKYGRNR